MTTLLKQTKLEINIFAELDAKIRNDPQSSLFMYSFGPGARPKPQVANSKLQCMLIDNHNISCGDIETNPALIK